MEKLSTRKNAVLEVLDEQIEALTRRLAKVQPLVDELNQLKKTRATLLSERTTTGSVGGARLTMEQVVHALRANDNEPMTPPQLAGVLGVNDATIRSHLNRHADTRYRKNGNGGWMLIGEQEDEEEEDD